MKRIREKLTYANVVATLALFLVLSGGAAYAASQLEKNSVGSKQLKKNAVTGAKIKNGSITGAKIKLSTLGTVPSSQASATAANAGAVGGKTAAQLAAASKLACPAGTKIAAGLCFEDQVRTADLLEALTTCGTANRRLPTPSELTSYDVQYFSTLPPYMWTDQIGEAVGMKEGIALRAAAPESIFTIFVEVESASQYRCVVPASN